MREDFANAIKVIPKIGQWLNKSSLNSAEQYLKDDEKVFHVETINLDKTQPGILVVTDKRVFFVFKLPGVAKFKQLPYESMSSVSMSTMFIGTIEIQTTHEKFNVTAIHPKRVETVYHTIVSHTT